MHRTYTYPALLERDEDGRYVVTFPDFGWGATDGATLEEALIEAQYLLRALIATTIREGEPLPDPSPPDTGQRMVAPPVRIALKAALHEACLQAGAPRSRLARDLGVAEDELGAMLNPGRATRPAMIENALRRMGKRVAVTVDEAA